MRRAGSLFPAARKISLMPPVWRRDGLLFEAISWIAARQTATARTYLKDPHLSSTTQGLDGLMIELDEQGTALRRATIFEDKCSANPRQVFQRSGDESFPRTSRRRARFRSCRRSISVDQGKRARRWHGSHRRCCKSRRQSFSRLSRQSCGHGSTENSQVERKKLSRITMTWMASRQTRELARLSSRLLSCDLV